MPIDDRTTNRSYKLPNAGNFLADDVQRLRDALTAIDADIFARYTKTETDQKLAALINGAPGALDTLNELAAAMGNDPNFAATITNALAGKPGFADVWTRTQADARYVQGITQTENTFTGTGSQTTFALSQTPPTRESLLVTVDGVVQPVSAYTLSGSALILSEAPASGASIRVLMLGVAGPVQSASTLNFAQAGTGAVTRTVESKLREVISVKDFGAVGDGVADDTTAIQACFNSLSNAFPNWFASNSTNGPAAVFFPRGLYKITDTLKVPKGILIFGANARNNGGSQIWQATSGKWIFDLYGFEYINGSGNTVREADQLITDLFFRSAGGAIKMDKRDYPSTSVYSPGSLRIDRCYFLNVNGGNNYACIWANAIEAIRNCTFDYVESPAFRGGCCHDFSGNVCWGGFVIDEAAGSGVSIVSNCWMAAGNGSTETPSTAGSFVVIGAAGLSASSLQISNCYVTKIAGGPGGHGCLITNNIKYLAIKDCYFENLTYPVFTNLGTVSTLQMRGNAVRASGGVAVTYTVDIGTVAAGSLNDNIFLDISGSAPIAILNSVSLNNFVIFNNQFVNCARSVADVKVTAVVNCAIRNNINHTSSLVLNINSIDASSDIQDESYAITGTISGFTSNFVIERARNQLVFSGTINRTSGGSFSDNTINLIAQIPASRARPQGDSYFSASVFIDGSLQYMLPILINSSGEVYLVIARDSNSGLVWNSSITFGFTGIARPAAVVK